MREYIYRQNIGSVDGSVVGSVVGQSWVKRGSHARSNHEEDVATTRNFVSNLINRQRSCCIHSIHMSLCVNLRANSAFRIFA